jgi:ribosome-associated protein
MPELMKVSTRVFVPHSEIELIAIRAQGPGGQAVNKSSSAVHLRFDVGASTALNEAQKQRILEHRDKRISASGVIVIKAQNHRLQERNKDEALKRLQKLLSEALFVAPKRRPTRPSWGSTKRRLKKKAERSQTKALRGRVRRED